MAKIQTLIPDILKVVYDGKEPKEEFLESFAKNVKEAARKSLTDGCKPKEQTLRMSGIGTPDRKIWYQLKGYECERITPTQAISFLYGHIIEELLLLLSKHAGHTVTREQEEVVLNGVKGHIDCFIDDVLVDCKGMSKYGFNKFETGQIVRQDSFGYIDQISGYAQALDQDLAAFFVFDKEKAHLTLFLVDDMEMKDTRKRIDHVRILLESDQEPKRCFETVKLGTTGNEVLCKECGWCPFKQYCWRDANPDKATGKPQGLRAFQYSYGVEYFTKIVREPRVQEIFNAVAEKETDEEIEA